jgi:hypothetical protein
MKKGLDVNSSVILELVRAGEKQWNVLDTRESKPVAEIHLDYYNQVDKIVFMNKIKEGDTTQLLVKQLVLSHAIQYVRRRSPILKALLDCVPDHDFREVTSVNMMDLGKIPNEITELTGSQIDKFLSEFVTIVVSRFTKLDQMFELLFSDIKERHGIELEVEVMPSRLDNDYVQANFRVKSGEQGVVFWKSADKPNSRHQNEALHITPGYHPIVNGCESIGLINGDTDALIRGSDNGVRSIYSPAEARVKKGFGSTWSYINHSFYAKGSSFGAEISKTLCLSEEGYSFLLKILKAALNLDNSFIAISGGFHSPYEYPGNILSQKKIPSPAGQHGAYNYRGSEHTCVWEYRTLEAEGKLSESYVPNWLYKEGWLEIYADQKPCYN